MRATFPVHTVFFLFLTSSMCKLSSRGFTVQQLGRRLDYPGLNPGSDEKFFSTLKRPDCIWGAHTTSYTRYRRGVKRPEREADHSRPYSVEIRNEWS